MFLIEVNYIRYIAQLPKFYVFSSNNIMIVQCFGCREQSRKNYLYLQQEHINTGGGGKHIQSKVVDIKGYSID